MIRTTVGRLQPHDRFRIGAATTGAEYTVKNVSIDDRNALLSNVYVVAWDRPLMTTVADTDVYVTSMVRKIKVPCHALIHGEELVEMLHDLASGPKPRGVFCGECASAADEAAG